MYDVKAAHQNDLSKVNYPYQRFTQIGLKGAFSEMVEEAKKHHLSRDFYGNINQNITQLNGDVLKDDNNKTVSIKRFSTEIIEDANRIASEYNSYLGGKSPTKNYCIRNGINIWSWKDKSKRIKKYHSDYELKQQIINGAKGALRFDKKTGLAVVPKYKLPSKRTLKKFIPISFGVNAVTNYKTGVTGGTIGFTEGIFKSVAANVQGLEFNAFLGISVFKLTDSIKYYLIKRQPSNTVFLYDGDAQNVSDKTKFVNSKRVNNFYQSSLNFSSQLLQFTSENNLNTKIYFAQIKSNLKTKGLDDLLQDARENNYLDAVLNDYNNINKKSEYFDFIKIYKNSYKRELKKHFALTNHVQFYERFKDKIGGNPFKFGKAIYKSTTVNRLKDGRSLNSNQLEIGQSVKGFSFFELINDSFKIDFEKIILWNIAKYIDDEKGRFTTLLNQNNRIAIQAPTGAGKTYFIIEYAKKNNLQIVLTVPTVALCKQISKEYKITSLHGKVNRKKLNKCLQSNIVVCTYDTLTRLEDLKKRILVVDESHNLVNAYGLKKSFRENTVRKITECFNICPKTVLLSGTTNKGLCKEYNFLYVDVFQKDFQKVNVQAVEAGDTITEAITQLSKIDFTKNLIHFVYLNNRDDLHKIKDHLIKKKILKESEIDVISRQDANNENCKFYNDIVDKSLIGNDAKLILTTCLLAEGINIKNTNIGKVFAINIDCVDSLKQYTARFREMNFIDVVSIRSNETNLKEDFFFDTSLQIKQSKESAENEIKTLRSHEKQFYDDFEEKELSFIEEIEDSTNYSYRSTIYPNVYYSNDTYKVDILRVLAKERERKIDSMNNAAFYTELNSHRNIFLQGSEVQVIDVGLQSELKEDAKEKKKEEKEKISFIVSKLLSNKEDSKLIIESYYFHLKQRRSGFSNYFYNHYQKFNEQSQESISFYEKHKDYFEIKTVKSLIRAFIILDSLDILNDNIELIEKFNKAKFSKFLNKIKIQGLILLYSYTQFRKYLSKMHKSEARILKKVSTNLTQFLDKKEVTTKKDVCEYLTKLGLKENQIKVFDGLFEYEEKRTFVGTKLHSFENVCAQTLLKKESVKNNEKDTNFWRKLLAII